jgi:hypothetical protein
MLISKVAIPRRRVLKGLGAAVALPFFDAMVPALSTVAQAATSEPRVGFVYIPHDEGHAKLNAYHREDVREIRGAVALDA